MAPIGTRYTISILTPHSSNLTPYNIICICICVCIFALLWSHYECFTLIIYGF
jgi:hypothetical protein